MPPAALQCGPALHPPILRPSSSQGHTHWTEAKIHQAAASASAAEGEPAKGTNACAVHQICPSSIAGNQPGAEAEGCLRLCNHLTTERVQYFHCLPSLSIHLRCDRGAAVQWKVLLLHGCKQARCLRVPVSQPFFLLFSSISTLLPPGECTLSTWTLTCLRWQGNDGKKLWSFFFY